MRGSNNQAGTEKGLETTYWVRAVAFDGFDSAWFHGLNRPG